MEKKREELYRELEEESRRSTLDGIYFFQAVAERSGMSMTDLQCVAILSSAGQITAGQLAEAMELTTGAVTGVINRMEKAGYVVREKDPQDGRRVVVSPVMEELERVGAGFVGSEEAWIDELMSGFSDEEVAAIVDFTKKANEFTRAEITRIKSASSGESGGAAPLGGIESGRLVFTHGASLLRLRSESGMEELYRAEFGGTPPKVKVEGGVVTVSRSWRFTIFDTRSHDEEFTLNADIPWDIEIKGGASQVSADLSGLSLKSLSLKAGMSEVEVSLPEPSGAIPVRLSGGASRVTIRRPAGVEARVELKGGASSLTFDEQTFDAVGGRVRLQSDGYARAEDRYDIELSGGASEFIVGLG